MKKLQGRRPIKMTTFSRLGSSLSPFVCNQLPFNPHLYHCLSMISFLSDEFLRQYLSQITITHHKIYLDTCGTQRTANSLPALQQTPALSSFDLQLSSSSSSSSGLNSKWKKIKPKNKKRRHTHLAPIGPDVQLQRSGPFLLFFSHLEYFNDRVRSFAVVQVPPPKIWRTSG